MSWILMLLITGSTNPSPLLGDENWKVREAMHSRLDNLLCSLLLPTNDPNPEIRHRLIAIHNRWDKYTSPAYYELAEQRFDYWKWFDKYCVQLGSSHVSNIEDIFEYMHSDRKGASDMRLEFFKRYPLRKGESQSWLVGIVFPGEFQKFMGHLDRFNKKLILLKAIGDEFLPYPTRLP